jgi:hypothetical protein
MVAATTDLQEEGRRRAIPGRDASETRCPLRRSERAERRFRRRHQRRDRRYERDGRSYRDTSLAMLAGEGSPALVPVSKGKGCENQCHRRYRDRRDDCPVMRTILRVSLHIWLDSSARRFVSPRRPLVVTTGNKAKGKTGSCKAEAGRRKLEGGSWKAEAARQKAKCKRQKWENRATNHFCLLPFALAFCLLLLPFAFCLLPLAFCLLPFASCLLPLAFCLPDFAKVEASCRRWLA